MGPVGCAVEDAPLQQAATALPAVLDPLMQRLEFSAALEAIMRVVTSANQYIETVAPWKLAKEPEQVKRLHSVLAVLAEVMRIIAITLEPFMPSVASEIWEQLGCGAAPRRLQDAAAWPRLPSGQPLGPHPVLFPRNESTKLP